MKMALGLLVMMWCTPALAAEKFIPDPENQIREEGKLTVSVPWIKDKGEKFDLNIVVHNEDSENGMIIFLRDMGCRRGKVRGELKYTFFNTGERTIDFRPNESKDFNMVCKVSGSPRGDFQLMIQKVYDNPSMDGKTVGKVIAKDLTWTQNDARN